MSENHPQPGVHAGAAKSTRRVMAPLAIAAAAFIVLVGLNAQPAQTFVPAGAGTDGLTLRLADPTPAASVALDAAFVPADETRSAQVLQDIAALAGDWQPRGIKVSVTPLDLDDSAVQFALQLDRWLGRYELMVEHAFQNEDLGELSRPPQVSGLVIRCREIHRAQAKALALAIAPLVRGTISIQFTERSLPRQLDIFVEAAPSFSAAGVAHFPGVDLDV